MEKERLQDLLFGYTIGKLSTEEVEELLSYVNLEEYQDTIYQSMEKEWNVDQSFILTTQADKGLAYHKAISELSFNKINTRVRTLKLFTLRKIASVAAVLILGFGILMLFRNYRGNAYENDIAPGASKATLTLANGKVISLESGMATTLAKESGITISKSADGQLVYTVSPDVPQSIEETAYNTLETPMGGQYRLILPDGTKVWLNASSSIKYPASFAKLKERKVQLSGEAYFEVAHNKASPFKVLSSRQEIEVLGTRFNVNAYNDESVLKTTLLEGSVKIYTEGNHTVVLRPGQQARVSDEIKVGDVDLDLAVAWKNGDFILKDEDFKTTMRKIERWYDVEVIYDESAPADLDLGGWVSRSKNISTVLHLMESTGKVHFKVQGRRITVTK